MTLLLALILTQTTVSLAPINSPAVDPAPEEDIVVTARRLNWFKATVLKNSLDEPYRCEVKNSTGNEQLDQRLCQGMITCFTKVAPRFRSAEAIAASKQNDPRYKSFAREFSEAIKPCFKRERRAALTEIRAQRRAKK
jgi:hypothetical protein